MGVIFIFSRRYTEPPLPSRGVWQHLDGTPGVRGVGVQINRLNTAGAALSSMVDVACQTTLLAVGVHMIQNKNANARFYISF